MRQLIDQLFRWLGYIHLEEHAARLRLQKTISEYEVAGYRALLRDQHHLLVTQRNTINKLRVAKCKNSATPPSTQS